jgi:hypothetical protein
MRREKEKGKKKKKREKLVSFIHFAVCMCVWALAEKV